MFRLNDTVSQISRQFLIIRHIIVQGGQIYISAIIDQNKKLKKQAWTRNKENFLNNSSTSSQSPMHETETLV